MRLILSILFGLLAMPVFAQCVGENLLDAMSPAKRVELNAAVSTHPYPSGNLWRAEKGDSTIHIMGTVHLNDPRLDDYLTPLWPVVDAADLILLEANFETMQTLEAALVSDLPLMFITEGPTLPDRLPEEQWQRLSAEMSARGMPGFMVSKMRPWFVAIMLGIPPCAMASMADKNGVDQRIIARAAENNIATQELEPYDTLFSLFNSDDTAQGIEMIQMALSTTDRADAMLTTLLDAYFAGDHRVIWEMSRLLTPGPSEDTTEVFNEMEAKLLTGRNANWMPVILAATESTDNILVAVGAAHLSGKDGLLYLLQQSGYALHRVEGF